MTAHFEIAKRPIGPDAPVYVIAELSANHNQDLDAARALVRAAASAGADAIKLQTYTADTITIRCDSAPFRISSGTLWDGRILHDLYEEAHTPWDWIPELMGLAAELGIHCFSSVFDDSSVDFLEKQHVPAYKIASFELVDLPLLRTVAATGKPVILSTGMARQDEIEEAIRTLRASADVSVALLHANSGYPARPDEMHLATIPHLARTFDVVAGLSDHTLGIAVPVAAVALGARIVEKHLTLSRARPGPDSAFSLEPDEFQAMVAAVRVADEAVRGVRTEPTEGERASLPFRRSLFVVEDVKAGERFTTANVRSIRPGAGLHTRHLSNVLGKRAARDLARGTPLAWDLVIDREG